MDQDIILDDEVMDVMESTSSGLGWKLGLGALAVAGLIWGGKKLKAKRDAKKSDGVITVTPEPAEEDVEVED